MNGAPDAAVFALMAMLTLASLWRELPAQYVLTITLVMYGISLLAFWLFKEQPWWLPLMVLNSRGVSRLILFKWRERPYYGWWLIGLTCLLTGVLFPDWGSLFYALIMQIAALPWLIKRRPGKDVPTYLPLLNWLLIGAWMLIRNFNFSFPTFHL